MSEPPTPDPHADSDEDEFAGIEPTGPRRSPVVALIVVALAALLTIHLRADLRYAFAPRIPLRLGDARTLRARGVSLEDNRYAEVSGMPDRRNALFLEARGETARRAFFRLLGTDGNLWVRALDTTGRQPLADRYVGRLRRFDALPYAASLRDYYIKDASAIRFLAPEALRAALGGTTALRDRAGEALTLPPDATVVVDLGFSDQLLLSLSREKYPSEPDARHELERLGLAVAPGLTTESAFEFTLAAPPATRDAILDQLDRKQIPFQLRSERYVGPLSNLKLDGDGLVLPKLGRVPWSAVKAAGLPAPIKIAGDAYVLTEGEAPGDFVWAPLVAALLLAFAAFNLWSLAQRRRARA